MLYLKEDVSIAENHTGYLTSKTLHHLKLLNKTWVVVVLTGDKTLDVCKSISDKFNLLDKLKDNFVLQLNVNFVDNNVLNFFDEHEDNFERTSYEDDTVYVSPGTLFNIADRDAAKYVKLLQDCQVELHKLDEFDEDRKQIYVSCVDISPVSCSFGHFDDEELLASIIKEHFANPKVLQKAEMFCIKIGKNSVTKLEQSLLWFQVKSLELNEDRVSHLKSNAVFVDERFSNLYLTNSVNLSVPVCPCTYLNNEKLVSFYRHLRFQEAFEGLAAKINNLFNIIFGKRVLAKDASILLEGNRGVGKGMLIRSLCQINCVHYHEENCFDLVGDSLSASEKRIEQAFRLAQSSSPCVLYLKNVHLLGRDREGSHEERRLIQCFFKQIQLVTYEKPIVIVGSTYKTKDMTNRFYSAFLYHFEVMTPNEHERSCLLEALCEGMNMTSDSVNDIAKKTAGFVLSDYMSFLRRLLARNIENANNSPDEFNQVTKELAETAIEEVRVLKAGSSSAVKIPKVSWNDVGGLQKVKEDIMDTLELPLKFPHLFSNGLQRSGLLFYGPPGCGKTLLAKAIATEFTLNFHSVKGPELINMYVGQSEENVRDVFQKARAMAPCVIFFDEIDSLAPNRGRSGDSGGVLDRVVSQLLAELDGMHDNTDVFVIGATNRPDLLDPSLLRPGRFDKLIYVGIPEGVEERYNILSTVTRKLKLSDDVNIFEIVQLCPPNLTGADFYSLASQSMMNCFRRMIREHEENGTPLNADNAVICLTDLEKALENLQPSVSLQELTRYQTIEKELLCKT